MHQTNITPESIGQILEATADLAKMFVTEPVSSFQEQLKPREYLLNVIPTYTGSDELFYDGVSYPSIHKLDTYTVEDMEWVSTHLSEILSKVDRAIDRSFEDIRTKTDLILTSFGSDPLRQFTEIFDSIANHPLTRPNDKLKAAELLIQAGGPSDQLTHVQFTIASDSAVDIRHRLNAANTLLKITDATEQAIAAYTQIVETVTSDTCQEKEDTKCSYLLEAGLALHKAGAMDQGLKLLADQFRWLLPKLTTKQFVMVNTSSMISATEILFNGKRLINPIL